MQETKLPESVITYDQKKTFTKKWLTIHWEKWYTFTVTIRYDDDCKNWHNSFSITWSYYIPWKRNSTEWGWCCHELIAEHFPELSRYIKWHFMNSDWPMHYIPNTLYWARNKTHTDKEVWEPTRFNTTFKFVEYPFTFEEHKEWFWEYLDSIKNFNSISIEEVIYDWDNNHNFSPSFSFTWFIKEEEKKKWYRAPFMHKHKAEEFLIALQSSPFTYIEVPYQWCEPVDPNLEAARRSAIWPDATLEQLNNQSLLLRRLPQLISEFINDIEELWFTY